MIELVLIFSLIVHLLSWNCIFYLTRDKCLWEEDSIKKYEDWLGEKDDV